jgi:hypothetical protein
VIIENDLYPLSVCSDLNQNSANHTGWNRNKPENDMGIL